MEEEDDDEWLGFGDIDGGVGGVRNIVMEKIKLKIKKKKKYIIIWKKKMMNVWDLEIYLVE